MRSPSTLGGLIGPDGHSLRHPPPQSRRGRIGRFPPDREQRRSRNQLHLDGSVSPLRHVHLPGESGQPHRNQLVVRLRQSHHSGTARPDHISPTNVIAALPEGSGLVMSRDAPGEDADCTTGYVILRAVDQRDLTALAGGRLQAERKGGIHLELDRPVHPPETAGGTTARAVALGSAVQNDLAQICGPRQTGGKS